MIKENIIEMFEMTIRSNWDRNALTDYKGETFTFADVAARVDWFHSVFKKSGIVTGDKISLLGRNSSHWAMAYVAVISYGAVIVPVLPDFHPDNVHHIVNHSDSKLLIVSKGIHEGLEDEKMHQLTGILCLEDFSQIYSKTKKFSQSLEEADKRMEEKKKVFSPERFSLEKVENDKLAVINYTSGTSGFSKGVMLPLNSLSNNAHYARETLPLRAGHRLVSFLPLAHVYGCAFDFLYPFSIGCHITLLSKIPSPKIIVKAFQEVKPHLILSVPLVLEKIYKKQIAPVLGKPIVRILSKVSFIEKKLNGKILNSLTQAFGGEFLQLIIGGAALNTDVDAFLKKIGFRFSVGYGMTECGPLVSFSLWDEYKLQSVGKAITGMEIKIDSGSQEEVGEILTRGENVMIGYYKNEEETARSIDSEGWLRTGDLGILDPDGFLFIKGRSKNMLLGPSGQNIYPEEIESKLNNMPYVQESLVLQSNNQLTALVYPDFEKADAEKLSEQDLVGFMEVNRTRLNEKLPAYSAIAKIKIQSEEFEKTPKKSIKRFLYVN